jgi:hypothetical protein
MLKIDRKAFLALALSMSAGGCYSANPPPAAYPRAAPAPAPGEAEGQGAMAAPHEECVGWTPTGECNQWEDMPAAPQDECVGWNRAGECNRWDPPRKCVSWTPTGECNDWEPSHE